MSTMEDPDDVSFEWKGTSARQFPITIRVGAVTVEIQCSAFGNSVVPVAGMVVRDEALRPVVQQDGVALRVFSARCQETGMVHFDVCREDSPPEFVKFAITAARVFKRATAEMRAIDFGMHLDEEYFRSVTGKSGAAKRRSARKDQWAALEAKVANTRAHGAQRALDSVAVGNDQIEGSKSVQDTQGAESVMLPNGEPGEAHRRGSR